MIAVAWLGASTLGACQPQRVQSPIEAQILFGGGEGQGDTPLEFDAEDRLKAPEGQWALFTEDHHCLTALDVTLENVVSTWFRVDIKDISGPPAEDGEPRFIRETARMCKQEISPVLLGLVSNIPQDIPDSLDPVVTHSTLLGEGAGDTYVSGLQLDLWGVRGVQEDDAMPDNADDERVFDQEGDGNPGATITLGEGGCSIYIVQRTTARRSGAIADASRIDGTFVGDLTQRVLDADNAFCKTENTLTDGGVPSRFVLMRVDGKSGSPDLDADSDGDVTCAEILAARGPLLASAGFIRQERDDSVCNPE